MPEWTKEQALAINGRSGSLLVSAAAGSGKTTVLVERVIQRLLDEANRCPADRLVIVTFTRPAAAQMKERIDSALSKRIAQNANPWLMKQQLLLQSAKICTIDSFCGDLVRENFHRLGISADFKVIDNSDNFRYEERAVNTVLGDMYASGNAAFTDLADLVSAGGSDALLAQAIKDIYTNISSYPFPLAVLGSMGEAYEGNEPVEQSVWGRVVLDECTDLCTYCLHLIEDAQRIALQTPDFTQVLCDDAAHYGNILALINAGEWDSLYNVFNNHKFPTFPQARKADAEIKAAVKLRRDRAKKVSENLGKALCVTSAQFIEDREALRPAVKVLLECVRLYSEELKKIKADDEALNFNDIEHLALELLVELDENGAPQKTPLAQSLSETYAEIMVDEYQDTNELQDMIFSAVSSNESNLFFVGDVKQSIYRFRQAMPEIFLRRRESVPEFDGKHYPARVSLAANFRSRNGVTKAVNYVFEQLMSKEIGDIDYNGDEQLNALADYPAHSEPDTTVLLRENRKDESEPEFVAKYIRSLLASGKKMREGDSLRPIVPGDICILVRCKTRMADYVAALESLGINAACTVDGETSGSAEVRIILSLLRVLDNPLQDIPLTAVMMSPLFGFTAGDLAKLRKGVRRGTPVYRSVIAAAAAGDKKCAAFLEKIDSMRRVSIGMGAADFMNRLFDESGIFSLACALSEPEQRIANLNALLDLAGRFDSSGGCGLSAFLRFTEKAAPASSDSVATGGSHSVKIMNIHKSKGLEFGVCILADLSSLLKPHHSGVVALSKQLGVGMLVRERFSGKTMNTLQHTACTLNANRLQLSEEVRVLYVAMTRAKEQLTLVFSHNKLQDKINSAQFAAPCGEKRLDVGYLLRAVTIADWLLPIFVRHADALELHTCGIDLPCGFVLHPDFPLEVRLYDGTGDKGEAEYYENAAQPAFAPDESLKNEIEARIKYVYPYSVLSRAASKKQASGFLDESFDDRYFASSRPAFMSSGGLTAAQKGTLTHKFMQLCSFADSDIKKQVEQLTRDGHFTEKEANELNLNEIEAFFSSEICARICASPNVMREKKFAMLLPVTALYPDLPAELENETVVVQGMVDLAFVENGEVVVVDYKTDRGVGDLELKERHFEQLSVYTQAIERCTDYKVSAAYIYSLPLKKEIKVI